MLQRVVMILGSYKDTWLEQKEASPESKLDPRMSELLSLDYHDCVGNRVMVARRHESVQLAWLSLDKFEGDNPLQVS